ncbi:chromosome partitioning protein ParB, partial [Bacteroidales bacterium OttesenSCG-928-I14]|nr:chromosome partitioning protein ParB [Bacteroidales bacterium OttesenSCG-928-I14]
PKKTGKPSQKTSREYDSLAKHLTEFFGTKIGFSIDSKGKGKITIPFKNGDELEKIIASFDTLKNI